MVAEIENNIFESVGILNAVNSNIFDNKNYTLFVINKVKIINQMVTQYLTNIETVSVEEAKVVLAILEPLKPQIKAMKISFDFLPDSELKNTFLVYLKNFKKLKYELEEIVIDDNMLFAMERDRANRLPEEMLSAEESKKSTENLRKRLNAMS
jgi:hypothetical protein